jgi:hypothetical protein
MSGYQSKKMKTNYPEGEIELHGLTKKQVRLLEKMWSIETTEDLQEWQETLDENTQTEVNALIQIILLEHLDNLLDDDYPDAQKVLSNFKLS